MGQDRQDASSPAGSLEDNTLSRHCLTELETAILDKHGNHDIKVYLDWYIKYLRSSFSNTQESLKDSIIDSPSVPKFDRFCLILATIAAELRGKSNITLSDIVNTLQEAGYFSRDTVKEESNLQLVFIAMGLLTQVYCPELNQPPQTFRIHQPKGHKPSSRDRTWFSFSTQIQKNISTIQLLLSFGSASGPIPRPHQSHSTAAFTEQDALKATYLSYYSLTRLAEIKVIWVDSLAEHLEFDRRQRVLKLYRFPSFCALLCSADSEKTFLCRIIADYCKDTKFRSSMLSGIQKDPPPSGYLLREIIASYRLLFGQDKPSRRVFMKDFRSMSVDDKRRIQYDPLLLKLCQEDWSKQLVFEDLDISNVRTAYSAIIDFPFFMVRLTNLREYVLTQQPTGWTSVWKDKRDTARYWGLLAVILFGVSSILLSLVQIGLGGAQVAIAIADSGTK